MLQSELELSLPYVTADLPGTGGVLRASPDDFVVEEVPLYAAEGDGQHLYVNITKVGLTTKEVQIGLERLFGLKKGDVSFAGMKDKRARTTQTFSLGVGHKLPVFAEAAARQIEANLPVTVNWVRFHRNKLKPGHLLGNRFAIRITELAAPPAVAQARAQAIAGRLASVGLPNYFGLQRLGEGGANVRQGWAIVAGERSKRDRWLQRFLISAYQSYLCNRYLARRLEVGAFDRLLAGDVAKKHATGGMFDVVDIEAEQPRYAAHEISFTAPLYGPKMWAAKDTAGELEAAVLRQEGVTLEDFSRVHVEGTRRMGRLLPQGLAVIAEGDSLILHFELRKGAFATTLLREVMKIDPAAMSAAAAIDDDDGDE
jgi:tRNA pseudouridine13 synthase